ncbi:hypothetical protein [Clostridium felsineum]|uniref:hypothetical protein n=1 Tax=Clostridium felsineum TaxID=36839 RepID=UPI00098C8710|nr:hypothetical protein [Clostridium felsineum]URZ14160.1 hypothetical protein CLFE_001450 [Clostridium felsineum DSM 794]
MKSYQFKVNEYLIGGSTAIREKVDVIKLLIGTIKYISSVTLDDLHSRLENDITVIIYVNKMSRIFYCQDEKMHTVQFPFSILEEDKKLKVYYDKYELDSKITTILADIFNHQIEFNESLESMAEVYYNTMKEYEVESGIYNELCWEILLYLLSFEPGYLRYDYDLERQDPIVHPLNHLDVYYSGKNTFKIGLDKKINKEDLIDILDINTNCKFLK